VDDMLAFYEERFGPYPFETYKAVVPQGLAGGAYSLHGVSVFARPSFTEQVVAQQLAQQWFGAAVTPKNRADTWLAQGFATYAETLWTIHTTGEDPIGDFYDAVAVLDPPGSLPPDDIFNLSAYERGAWMLKALNLRLGDDVFFEIMRTYVARYRYDAVSAEDFIAVAEEISGEDLGDFFQGWLYDPVAPPVPELGLGGE
jgi:aminopeptidase N